MGLGLCLVYGFESYSLWGLCEGLVIGNQDLYLCWVNSKSHQCET